MVIDGFDMDVGDVQLPMGRLFSCFPLEDSLVYLDLGAEALTFTWWVVTR